MAMWLNIQPHSLTSLPYQHANMTNLATSQNCINNFIYSMNPVRSWRCSSFVNMQIRIYRKAMWLIVRSIVLKITWISDDKILVLYLHSPLLFYSDDLNFSEYTKILSYALSNYSTENSKISNDSIGKSGIPPLWYVLSTISLSDENRIEKFFIRTDNTRSGNIFHKLSRLSHCVQ